jgi:mutator protein MutT
VSDRIDVSKVVLRRRDGKVLIVEERESGKWELPGGKIEAGEDRIEAASRELEEETGVEPEDFEDVVRVEVESDICVNCYILLAECEDPEIDLYENELSDFRWIQPEEFRTVDWHADAGYAVPALVYLEDYVSS